MEFLKSNIDPEWDDLVNEFPEIILDLSPEVLKIVKKYDYKPEDVCNLRYGFECGIGWKEIIREFFQEIRELVNTAKDAGHDINYKTFILKEKFGELRDQGDFYGEDRNLYWKQYTDISSKMEIKSNSICEECGKAGKNIKGDWVRTLCVHHEKSLRVIEIP